MPYIEKLNGSSYLVAEQGDNGTYTITGTGATGLKMTQDIDINVAPGALEVVYEIPAAGTYPLFYEKVSPAGNENTISVFPQGTNGKLTKEGSNKVDDVELYHSTTSKADTCFTYEFTEAGTYTLLVETWNGNTNDPGTHNPDDLGMGVYAQMFRGSKITTLKEIKGFAFPSNTASFYSMFNSCTATGHFPSVMCDCVTRPTDMFDSAKFESIGNVIFPNAWKPQTSGAVGSDQAQSASKMFLVCSNLKSVGNVILGDYCINTSEMFNGCSKLERIGVLDCMKNATNCTEMFKGCSKLTSIKIKSLPIASGIVVDFSGTIIDEDSWNYMGENVNDGAATIVTNLYDDNDGTLALRAKGYNVVLCNK